MMTNEKIKAIRQALGINQESLGEPLGISKGHISGVENGFKQLSSAAISLLRIHFKVNPAWWETGEGEMFLKKEEPEGTIFKSRDVLNLSVGGSPNINGVAVGCGITKAELEAIEIMRECPSALAIVRMMKGMDSDTQKDLQRIAEKEKQLQELLKDHAKKAAA